MMREDEVQAWARAGFSFIVADGEHSLGEGPPHSPDTLLIYIIHSADTLLVCITHSADTLLVCVIHSADTLLVCIT